jgi:hypothetical protein
MSLQAAAQHLSSHGRGNDSMMVHMSPREVSSLNAIAKAHGGQLTTNPHTGLPEAGFLESILPMAAGAALVASGVGAPYAAMMVGGGTALMTGSLEKGLMAGLGAYGGAGLGSSLMASGATPAAAGATELGISEAMQAQHAAQVTAAQTAQQAQQAAAIQNAAIQQASTAAPVVTNLPPQGAMNSADLLARQNAMSGSQAIDASVAATPPNPNHYSVMTGNSPAFQAPVKAPPSFMDNIKTMGSNISPSNLMKFVKEDPLSAASGAASLYPTKKKEEEEAQANNADMGQRYAYSPGYKNPMPGANASGQEPTFMDPSYRKIDNAEAKKIYGFADGGATADPAAPPVPTSYTAAQPSTPITTPAPAFEVPEVNSVADLIRAKESQRFIDAYLNRPAPIDVQGQYNDYLQRTLNAPPTAVANSGVRTIAPSASTNADDEYIFDANTQRYVPNPKLAETKAKTKKKSFFDGSGATNNVNFRGTNSGVGGLSMPQPFGRAAGGSISDAGYNLGGYSDGGRLLRGPGDGVSDSIPAVIGKKQPARLADGEFVVPARIVSELGNGSTEAGARKLYAMMDRIQKARGKTVGKGKVAKNSRSDKYLPA